MRRATLVFVLLAAHTLVAGEPSRIEGTVTIDGAVLPGTIVQITSHALKRTTISDAMGRYAFDALPPGTYDLTFEMAGLQSEEKRVTVDGGTTQLPAQLTMGPVETITWACSLSPCRDGEPESEWDSPSCADYELDTILIEALDRNDASARDLLRQRFETTFTYFERHRIAGALLNRVDDDSRYWKELERHAAVVVRFPEVEGRVDWTPAFVAWCAERSLDPEDYWNMAFGAFSEASDDPRSRPLLLRALDTDSVDLLMTAIYGFALQRGTSALPAIEAVLKRKDVEELVLSLSAFLHPAADEIAMKYLDEDQRAIYADWRRRAESERVNDASPSTR